MKIEVGCSVCSACFYVEHAMNPRNYTINHCPFCGDEDGLDVEDSEWDVYEEEYDE